MNTFETYDETKRIAKGLDDIFIEDSRLYFHNFDGKSKFNQQSNSGYIEYGVFIEDEAVAEKWAQEGWDIRVRQYEDGNKRYYIKAIINFEPRSPKTGEIIEEYKPSVFVYVEGSDSMTQITSKEEMAMYENNDEKKTRVDVVKVDCQLGPKPTERPTPHIVAYTRHVVFTVRIIEKESNANIRFNKFAGIKGYSE